MKHFLNFAEVQLVDKTKVVEFLHEKAVRNSWDKESLFLAGDSPSYQRAVELLRSCPSGWECIPWQQAQNTFLEAQARGGLDGEIMAEFMDWINQYHQRCEGVPFFIAEVYSTNYDNAPIYVVDQETRARWQHNKDIQDDDPPAAYLAETAEMKRILDARNAAVENDPTKNADDLWEMKFNNIFEYGVFLERVARKHNLPDGYFSDKMDMYRG